MKSAIYNRKLFKLCCTDHLSLYITCGLYRHAEQYTAFDFELINSLCSPLLNLLLLRFFVYIKINTKKLLADLFVYIWKMENLRKTLFENTFFAI